MVVTFVLILYFETISAQETIIGGPCGGCELVFVDMPTQLQTNSRIAPVGEKGETLVLNGTVSNADGSPASGIIVYAYQTDANGIYPKGSTRHGRLRGWALSDQKGRYRFETIRPRAYSGGGIPQHIHMHIIEPNKATYYIDNITFDDDSLLTSEHRKNRSCRGGCGISRPERNDQGVWHVRRNIILREGISE